MFPTARPEYHIVVILGCGGSRTSVVDYCLATTQYLIGSRPFDKAPIETLQTALYVSCNAQNAQKADEISVYDEEG